MPNPRWLCALVALLASCSSGDRGGEVAGKGSQAFVSDLFVVGTGVIDPTTYHWVDPSLLITSTEGAGPRTLDIAVSTALTPHVSYTGTRTPSHAEISEALGYDVAQTVQVSADSSVLVPVYAYARIAAYPTFQVATWDVIGPGGIVYGTGRAYKPTGVSFDTCGGIGTDPCGSACVGNFPYGPPPAAGADAGAPAETGADAGAPSQADTDAGP